jgi:hypothetical protein
VRRKHIDMQEDVQYNKSCLQKMAQTPMDSQDPDLASKPHQIILVPDHDGGRLRNINVWFLYTHMVYL